MIAYLLNLADLALTLHALQNGGVELNPLMRNIYVQIFYKVFVIGMLLFLLYKCEARAGIKICTAVFAAVDVWHILNLFLIWGSFR